METKNKRTVREAANLTQTTELFIHSLIINGRIEGKSNWFATFVDIEELKYYISNHPEEFESWRVRAS